MIMTTMNKPVSKPTNRQVARILIVDDHPIVRRGLAQLIAQEPDLDVCGEAADAPEAMQQVSATQPDLAVIDISLKSGNGIELVKQIKAVNDKVKMLVSSMHDESLYAERALRAGAKGFINKEEATTNIIEAIRQILRGKVYLSGRMTERVLQQVVNGDPVEQSPVDSLSDRELEVFELIGQGLTTRQIANKLHLSVKTIETHRDNIKSKLHLKNGTQLTHRAVRWAVERA
jgi:DNA-binding NarL/FixJ family response regulator